MEPHRTRRRWMQEILGLPFVAVAIFEARTGRWVAFNDRFCEVTGYGRSELARKRWQAFFPAEDHVAWDSAFRKVAGEGADHARVPHRLIRTDGSTVPAETNLSRSHARDASGQYVIALIDARDIGVPQPGRAMPPQNPRDAIEQHESVLRAVVEESLAGIYVIEAERFIYANPRLAQIFGYAAGELTGKPFMDLVAPPDRDLVRANVRRRLEGAATALQYEFRGLRSDGSEVEVGVHGAPTMFGGRRVIVGVAQDITDRRNAERRLEAQHAKIEAAMLGALGALSRMVDLRDPYTAGHELRVAGIAAAIARDLAMPGEEVRALEVAGRVHDIGKISVPSEILAKPTRLLPAEYELVKMHVDHGFDILRVVDFPWPIALITRQHHERLDGRGYPQGLKDGAILPAARILAVADVIEAMASHRPYRASLGVDPALSEIEAGAGSRYDADVCRSALRMFRDKGFAIPA